MTKFEWYGIKISLARASPDRVQHNGRSRKLRQETAQIIKELGLREREVDETLIDEVSAKLGTMSENMGWPAMTQIAHKAWHLICLKEPTWVIGQLGLDLRDVNRPRIQQIFDGPLPWLTEIARDICSQARQGKRSEGELRGWLTVILKCFRLYLVENPQ